LCCAEGTPGNGGEAMRRRNQCLVSRERGNVEVAAIVLRGRDTGERRGGDGKEKHMTTCLLRMFREFDSGFFYIDIEDTTIDEPQNKKIS
jgi:hypothetical protein